MGRTRDKTLEHPTLHGKPQSQFQYHHVWLMGMRLVSLYEMSSLLCSQQIAVSSKSSHLVPPVCSLYLQGRLPLSPSQLSLQSVLVQVVDAR